MMTPTLRPKLLYLTAAYRPGSMAIPVHTELLAALAERGYPSAIVTLAPPGQREPVLAVPDGDLPVYRVAISRTLLDRVANRYARTRFIYPYLITTARYLRPWLRAQLAADPAIIVQGEMAFPMGALLRRALVGTPARSVVTLRLVPGGAARVARGLRLGRRRAGDVAAAGAGGGTVRLRSGEDRDRAAEHQRPFLPE
jgi:hypothetical protein